MIIYKQVKTQKEIEQVKKFIYEAYLKSGLINENDIISLDNNETYIASNEKIYGTISIIKENLPMRNIFPEMEKYPIAAEAGSLAVCEDANFSEVIIKLISLVAKSAIKSDIYYVVIYTHPKHAKFYKRIGGCEEFTQEVKIHHLNNAPAVGLVFDIEKIKIEKPGIYKTFFG